MLMLIILMVHLDWVYWIISMTQVYKKKNIEFFEDFDDGNKPVNEFSIHLNSVILELIEGKKIIFSKARI